MKDGLKKVLGCVGVLCALWIALSGLTRLFEDKTSYIATAPFLEEKENFDVLFIGNSHMQWEILPMELWKDYGIVSYNLGMGSTFLPTAYWELRNALDYTEPRLVVVEGYAVSSAQKVNSEYSIHVALDAFPLRWNKVRAAVDLLTPAEGQQISATGDIANARRTGIGVLWDFAMFHSRWSSLTATDFDIPVNIMKGTLLSDDVVDSIAEIEGDRSASWERTAGTEYLGKIIELCRSRGIEVCLAYMPYANPNWREVNAITAVAREYGVDCLNYLDLGLVNYTTDQADVLGHLNASGAKKVTQYMGRYIQERYGIPDQRQNPAYSKWNEDYQRFADCKVQRMKSHTALKNYLMVIADKNYDLILELDDPTLLERENYAPFFQNLGIDTTAVPAGSPSLIVCAGGRAAQVFPLEQGRNACYETELGQAALQAGAVLLNGEENIPALGEGQSACVRICVRDKDTGAILDVVNFDLATQTAFR